VVRDEGRIGVTPEALRTWASELRPDDEVALEATGNSDAIATLPWRGKAAGWHD
jgi:transposase